MEEPESAHRLLAALQRLHLLRCGLLVSGIHICGQVTLGEQLDHECGRLRWSLEKHLLRDRLQRWIPAEIIKVCVELRRVEHLYAARRPLFGLVLDHNLCRGAGREFVKEVRLQVADCWQVTAARVKQLLDLWRQADARNILLGTLGGHVDGAWLAGVALGSAVAFAG